MQANHLVSVLRTIIAWGIQRGYSERNPAVEVVAIDILDEQTLGPGPRKRFGSCCMRRPSICAGPLTWAASRVNGAPIWSAWEDEIDGTTGSTFGLKSSAVYVTSCDSIRRNSRCWIRGNARKPALGLRRRGAALSGDHLAASLRRFIASHPDLKDVSHLTPHGWRAMAVCDRRLAGLEHQEISAQLCMSLQMVMRYSKHIDGEARASSQREAGTKYGRVCKTWPLAIVKPKGYVYGMTAEILGNSSTVEHRTLTPRI